MQVINELLGPVAGQEAGRGDLGEVEVRVPRARGDGPLG